MARVPTPQERSQKSRGATVLSGSSQWIATDRNRGGPAASGDWLVFLGADVAVTPDWLDQMVEFLSDEDLVAGSSRSSMPGIRGSLMAGMINHVFPKLQYPIPHGFNFWIDREIFDSCNGFPPIPNEDTAFSRRLVRRYSTGYPPDRLVIHSVRRIRETGLTVTLYHYARLDTVRIKRSDREDLRTGRPRFRFPDPLQLGHTDRKVGTHQVLLNKPAIAPSNTPDRIES